MSIDAGVELHDDTRGVALLRCRNRVQGARLSGHIGIVAVSPEGAALFYQRVARRASQILGDGRQPRITVHNEPLHDYLEAIRKDDWHAVGRLLRKSADHLVRCGAQILVTPDNVVQHGVSLAEVGSAVPWLTMPDLVAQSIGADGRKKIGIIGTKLVTDSSTYQTHLGLKGISILPPEPRDTETLEAVIFGELIFGRLSPASAAFIRRLLENFKQRGCDGIVLALSEGGLLMEDVVSPLPVYDASLILADRIVADLSGTKQS
jgi:aspartate racemase